MRTHSSRDPHGALGQAWYGFKVVIAFTWAIPWTAVGIVLCATIVGIPLGLLFIAIGCAPYAFLEKSRVRQLVAWKYRDRSYGEEYDEEPPWEM